jgi:hypothetical protein
VINMTDESAVSGQEAEVRALIAVMSVPVAGVMVRLPNVPAGEAALASSLIKNTDPATTTATSVPDTSFAKIFLLMMSLTSLGPGTDYGICADVDAGAGDKSVVGRGTSGGSGGVEDTGGDVVGGGTVTVGSGGELDVGAVVVVVGGGELVGTVVVVGGTGGFDVGAGNVGAGEVVGGAATVAAAAWAATPGEVTGPEGTGPGADCVEMTPVRYARSHSRTMFT